MFIPLHTVARTLAARSIRMTVPVAMHSAAQTISARVPSRGAPSRGHLPRGGLASTSTDGSTWRGPAAGSPGCLAYLIGRGHAHTAEVSGALRRRLPSFPPGHRWKRHGGGDFARLRASSSSSSSSSSPPSSSPEEGSQKSCGVPWALMGRSVHEEHLLLSKDQIDELALGAVADESGVDVDTLRANMRRLESLCPPLVARRRRGEVKAADVARLALDLPSTTAAMLGVKELLPQADAAALCAKKTALFTPEGVARAKVVAAAVRRGLAGGDADADALLASVPDALVTESDDVVDGFIARAVVLQRLLPGANLAKICAKRPDFLMTSDAGAAASKVGHPAGVQINQPAPLRGATPQNTGRDDENDGKGEVRETSESGEGSGDPDAWVQQWHVARSVREMRRRMPPECDTDRLLTDFPNILAMDVPALFDDLARVFPAQDPGDVLRRNPRIAFQVPP